MTEEVPIERKEERRIRLLNETKKKRKDHECISSHTGGAIKPVAVTRYSRFITVHVKQAFKAARLISYYCLF
ncbi:MAG: hypothetical protein MJE68_09985 [Proteobacteria bacterium]|nr:hypothetical protein [Pseudomonadota bacterium]